MSFLQLYPDPNSRPEVKGPVVERVDIIAIHGLTLNTSSIERNAIEAFATHKPGEKETIWLRDLLPKVAPHSRVLLYCFDVHSSFGLSGIDTFATEFLNLLLDIRRHDPHRPIIFIGHNLGGLIIKRALIIAFSESNFAHIKTAARAIVFFGTPHRGYEPGASLKSTILRIYRKLYVQRPPLHVTETFSRRLRDPLLWLYRDASSFPIDMQWWKPGSGDNLNVVSFYENIGSIVTKESSTLGYPREVVTSINAAHRDICKFADETDVNYAIVRDSLMIIVEKALSSESVHKDLDYQDAQLLRRLYKASNGSSGHRLPKSLPGTGEWLLSHTQFSEWLASKSRLAWIVGKPGTGKSTIASFFVNKLQQLRIDVKAYLPYTEEVLSDALQVRTPKVLSFFCDYYDPPSNAVVILWSLLHQLLAEQPSLLRYISPDVRLRCGQRTVQASFIARLLIHVAEYTDIIVVIDALDECEEPIRDDLLRAFSVLENGTEIFQTFSVYGHDVFGDQMLCNPTRSSIKVLITSRLELEIDPSAFVIDLSEKEAAERMAYDIGLVIDAGIDRMRNQGLLLDIQTKLVRQVLGERADGVFLWAELQLKSLESYLRISNDLDKFLQHLPMSLNETYESIFISIQQKPNARLALRALQWITYALRPLSIYELVEAITFEPEYSNILDNCYMNVNIMDLCGSFVKVDTATSTVSLTHRSAREYLMLNDISSAFSSHLFEIPLSNADRGHNQLTQYCLTYLTFVSFEEQCTKCAHGRHGKRRKSVEHRQDFPFLSYAAVFWSKHIALISTKEADESYGNLIHDLINPKSTPFRTWFPIYWLSQCTETWERKRYPEYPTELIVLAFLGNEKAIRSMFRWKSIVLVDECTPAGEEWTPLMAAAWMGNGNVVDLLLERGAGYGTQPQQNTRTLVAAIERGHIKIAQKLIAHFAKIQSSMTSGRSIFDSSSEDEGATPLLAAICGGHNDVVVSLVDQGANVNVHRRSNFQPMFPSWVPLWNLEMPSTPIGAAISGGNVEILNILIGAGADVFGSNSLHVASSLGNMDLVKLLVEKGASIDTKYNQDGWSLLHTAAYYGSIDIIRFLLDSGASPETTDKIGRSPIWVACESGNLEVVKLLCKNNEASPMEFEDEAAILRLAHCSTKEYLLALRRKPISPQNANSAIKSILTDTISTDPPERAWLSFQPAHESRRLVTVAYLLDHGADPFFKDAYGNTFLHYAAARHYGSIVKFLLDLSPGIDIQNEEGQTALDLAVYYGDADFCRPFLNRTARVSRVTLNNALQSGSHTVIRLLSENITHVPYSKALIQDLSTVKFQLSLQGLGPRKDGLTSGGNTPQLKRISPRFKRVIDFLDRRQLEHLEKIELSDEDNFPLSNAVKSWIEDRSGSEWIWWPLTPRLHPLEPGEVWLKWTCQNGYEHREKIASSLAQEIEQYLEFHSEILKATGVATGNSPGSRFDTARSKDRHGGLLLDRLHPENSELPGILKGTDLPSVEGNLVIYPVNQVPPLHLVPSAPFPNVPTTRAPANPHHSPQNQPSPATQQNSHQVRARSTSSVSYGSGPSGPWSNTARSSRRHRRPTTQRKHPKFRSNPGSWVLFNPRGKIVHINVMNFPTDQLFFDELKREDQRARGWVKESFSIWRYHHSNFDKFVRSRDNLVTSLSSGSRTSNYLPVAPHDINYEFDRVFSMDGDPPISQLEFRNMYRACSKLCCWWFRLTHNCNAPTNTYSPNSPLNRPTDHSLRLIPKKKTQWDIYENYRGEAWGLTPFELPCFVGFMTYFFLSVTVPIIFWALWLSIWNHPADLQNASVPALVTLALWTLLWQSASGSWNSDRDVE